MITNSDRKVVKEFREGLTPKPDRTTRIVTIPVPEDIPEDAPSQMPLNQNEGLITQDGLS